MKMQSAQSATKLDLRYASFAYDTFTGAGVRVDRVADAPTGLWELTRAQDRAKPPGRLSRVHPSQHFRYDSPP